MGLFHGLLAWQDMMVACNEQEIVGQWQSVDGSSLGNPTRPNSEDPKPKVLFGTT
jgi:hypothetical protein